jgi:hypothetical protein
MIINFHLKNRFDRLTMDQLTARKLLQRPRLVGSGAGAPSNGAPVVKSNNLSPWNSPNLSQRQLVKNNHLNSSVQYLTTSGAASPVFERRSVNEGSLTGAKFTVLTTDENDSTTNRGRDAKLGLNGEMVRKKPIKNIRRPRSLSEDRRNSDDYEHLALLSPSEVCIRTPDTDPEAFKMETAIV